MSIAFIVALVAVVALLAVVAMALRKPDTFTVERRIQIAAPAASTFELVNDFQHWAKWSPWDHMDPAMVRAHSGADRGVGAVYEWTGNSKVGAGRMEIMATVPGEHIEIKLNFLRPFKSQNTANYRLVPNAQGHEFIWSMSGPMLFISKVMSVFVSMDQMIGKDFERGLAQLKAVAQRP